MQLHKQKQPRLPRIERAEEYHVEDDSAHGWAVSYADFLMVLLSFFILFFSTETSQKNNLIMMLSDQAGQKGEAGQQSITGKSLIFPKDLQAQLGQFQVKSEQEQNRLTLMFADDLYPLGKVDLPGSGYQKLRELLQILKPHQERLLVTFIGHTDSTGFSKNDRASFIDNFDLSVIRASRALQIAVREGFPPENLSARGAANHERATRSLSISIQEKP